jgi:hypothetical protein
MLGFAEAGQVGIDRGGHRTFMAEIDLDLTKVLALLQEVGGVGMAQGVDMGGLFDAAGFEGQAESALQSGAAHRFGGCGRALAAVAFGREEKAGMPMGFPKLPQQMKGALGQRHVTVAVAFAAANVQEHPLRIDVADFEPEPFAQAQSAGIDRRQTDAVIELRDIGEDPAHFLGGENHREFELGIGPDQFQFVRPLAFEGFFPEYFDGANGLGGSLAGNLLGDLEVNAILADFLGPDQLRGFAVMLAELAEAGEVSLFGAGADGEQFEIIGEGF